MPVVTAVGLGPGGTDLLLPAARAALASAPHRVVRTARHPAVVQLAAEGMTFEACDDCYDAAGDLDAAYQAIVDRVVARAEQHGSVVYAVPGSPVVAERTVPALRDRAGIALEVIPGVSFADLAWTRLGIDPLAGARVVDGRRFALEAAGAGGALLVAQCDTRLVLSEVKLTLLDTLDAEAVVTVLQRLGLPDERVEAVALADLDRVVEPDHLTSVFVDTGEAMVAPEVAQLYAITQQLRAPGGCPWDRKQTHHSLARHTLEEAYEVVEAIEALPVDAPGGDEPVEIGAYDALEDELGDLLFQVCIHSVLAAEAGAFTLADVARRIHDKLIRRHPHVFGDVEVDDADDVVRNWEQIKKDEKQHASLMDGITTTLPALLYLPKLFRKAAAAGLDPAHEADALLRDALDAVADRPDADAIGALLAAGVALARANDVDAETALRSWAERYRSEFQAKERAGTVG